MFLSYKFWRICQNSLTQHFLVPQQISDIDRKKFVVFWQGPRLKIKPINIFYSRFIIRFCIKYTFWGGRICNQQFLIHKIIPSNQFSDPVFDPELLQLVKKMSMWCPEYNLFYLLRGCRFIYRRNRLYKKPFDGANNMLCAPAGELVISVRMIIIDRTAYLHKVVHIPNSGRTRVRDVVEIHLKGYTITN